MATALFICFHCGKELIRKVAPSIRSKRHFCDNECKGEWQRTQKPVSREWLVEHYIEKEMNTTQIAHIVRRDPKSVWNWLKDLEIPTRPRGSSLDKNLQRGQPAGFRHTVETRRKMQEIAKTTGRVPYDPAIGSYMKGRYGEAHPGWKGGISPERQDVYASKEWCEAIKVVWARDNAMCRRCGKHHNEAANRGTFDIHHIVSFAVKDLRTNPDNLVLLCEGCHMWVHSRVNTEHQFISEGNNGR